MEITTVGIDLAKNVFQVHAVSRTGEVIVRRALRRAQMLPFFAILPPCLIGMEACGTSHHWARELTALGHEVRLMPPAYVKPYVKRGKTDAADAEAICEAVTRPTMRFVPIKSVEQQAALALHRTRDLLVRQRTQLVNTDGKLVEYGINADTGELYKSENQPIERYFTRLKPADFNGAKTSLKDALALAETKAGGGKAYEAEVEKEGASVQYDIKVALADRERTVKVKGDGTVMD